MPDAKLTPPDTTPEPAGAKSGTGAAPGDGYHANPASEPTMTADAQAAPPAAPPGTPEDPPPPRTKGRSPFRLWPQGAAHVARGASRSARAFRSTVENVRSLTWDMLLVVVLFAISFVSWRVFAEDEIAIRPITVPEQYAKNGYTADVAALRLRDALAGLLEYQSSDAQMFGGQFSLPIVPAGGAGHGVPNVEVHGVGLSFNQLVLQLRESLDRRTRQVSGELIADSNGLCLYLRYTAEIQRRDWPRIVVCTKEERPNIDRLIERGAGLLMFEIVPEFVLRFPPNERTREVQQHVSDLYGRLGRSGNVEDRALSYEISAAGHWYRGGDRSYALRELRRAIELSPNARRVLSLAIYSYHDSLDVFDARMKELSRDDPARNAKYAAIVRQRLESSAAILKEADRESRPFAGRDRNFDATMATLEGLMALWRMRYSVSTDPALDAKSAVKRAESELRDAWKRLMVRHREIDFDHGMIVAFAHALKERGAARRHCDKIDGINPVSIEALNCQYVRYQWVLQDRGSAAAVASALGTMLDRFLENLALLMPRDRGADAPALSLGTVAERYRMQRNRESYYNRFFQVVAEGGHFARLDQMPDLTVRSVAARSDLPLNILAWAIVEMECFVHNREDSLALVTRLARSFTQHATESAGSPLRAIAAKMSDRAAMLKARGTADESSAAAKSRIEDLNKWRDTRCALMDGWRKHESIRTLPLKVHGR